MKTTIWYKDVSSENIYDLLTGTDDFEFVGYISDSFEKNKYLKKITNADYNNIQLIVLPTMDQFQYRDVIRYLYEQRINYSEKIYMTSIETLKNKLEKCKKIEDILRIDTIPFIPSLEYEVSKSCNLNCKRCNHFSNLQPVDTFANFESFNKDIIEIKKYIEEIGTFYLVGGEPLLNTHLHQYIKCIGESYPNTKITILTNGILIKHMSDELMDTIKKNDVVIGISFYPVVENSKEMCEFLDHTGIQYFCFNDIENFTSFINIEGNSEPIAQMHTCMLAFAHSFENGKIFKCCMSENIGIFNKKFKTNLPTPFYNFRKDDVSAKEIQKFLLNSTELCKFCRKEKAYKWELSRNNIMMSDWCE